MTGHLFPMDIFREDCHKEGFFYPLRMETLGESEAKCKKSVLIEERYYQNSRISSEKEVSKSNIKICGDIFSLCL